MFNRIHTKTLLLGCAAACALATAANAQSADQESQLEEVIVTAQLRAQDPIEVPFALTAYSGQFLENLGVQDFEELSAFVPGLLVQNQSPNNPGFVMRGITSDSTGAADEARVSIYQDGVSISRAPGAFVELFDIERVEAAKGPQSTLYGRGALIGAVNIIQNKAELGDFDASATAGFGNYDYRMVELMANLPVGEDAALRLATRIKSRDGYVENLLGGDDYNSVDTRAFRALFAYAPTDALRVDIIGNYQDDTPSGVSFRSIAYSPQDSNTGAVLGDGGREPWDGAALTPGTTTVGGGRDLGIDREVWGVTGLVRYDLSDSLTLNSTTAYRTFESSEVFDPDGLSLPLLTGLSSSDGEQWSQELRLNWNNGGAFSGFIGAGYFREETDSASPIEINERVALFQLAGALGNPATGGTTTLPLAVFSTPALLDSIFAGFGLPNAPGLYNGIRNNLKSSHIETARTTSELESFDIFGDLTWKPTERLEIAVGVRYTSDDKTTGFSSRVENGRSVLGSLAAIQSLTKEATRLAGEGNLAEAFRLQTYLNNLVPQLARPDFLTAPASAAFPMYGVTFQPTAGNGDLVTQGLSDDGFTWRLTGRYAVTDDASLYATYARGRRPAVLSAAAPRTPNGLAAFGPARFTPVDAEEVDSYEIGAKTALLGRSLRLEGAAYYYEYQNFQTTVQEGTLFITTNAGQAESYGFEGQVFYAPTDTLDLFGTYGYNHSRFAAGIFDGNRFRLSPDHRYSVGLVYRIPFAGGDFEIVPTYSWQSEMFFDNDNDRPELQTSNFVADSAVDERQGSYGLLNLRLRYKPASANWTVEAFGDNLLDEEFIKDAGNTGDGFGLPTFIAGEPRTYGVTVSVRY